MISLTFAIAFAVRFRGALLVSVLGVVVVVVDIGAILLRKRTCIIPKREKPLKKAELALF
jgi:CDP-diglyceride synthetase